MKSANSHRIAFAPETGVTPAEFVNAWNDLEDCRKEARADLARQGSDPGLAAAWASLAPVAAGLATSVTVELVKRALSRADEKKGQTVTERVVTIQNEDGVTTLIIRPAGGAK